MAQAPPLVVEGISRVSNPYGLFSQVNFRTPSDQHWSNGIEWQTIGCDAVSGIADPTCDSEEVDGLPKQFTPGIPLGEASGGFTVYGSHVCAPTATSVADAQSRATAKLLIREEARVERAFWTGDLGNTPNLSDATDITPSPGTAVDPVLAIALLENWLAANYGSVGLIHMTRGMAVAAIAAKAVETKGSTGLQTRVGTPVVAGFGYPGTSPSDVVPDPDESWIYASPPLFGYRSEVFTSSNRSGDLLDRAQNDLFAVAERTYLLAFDPCGTAAVQVSQT